MKITGIIWLDDVVEKIESKHHVSEKEVEEVISNKPKIRKMHSGHFRGEHVYRALGRTYSGRYLTVFFIHKLTGEALILSARDMDEREHKSYVRK
ncbi:MAG: BrnT family toxin [bacterium]|nr:MAG: BrnT family toxin [bacterium]